MNFDPDLAKARIVLCRLACRREPFTSDDMRDLIQREGIEVKPQSIGAAIAEAKVAGYVTQTGEIPSRRPENHRRKIDVLVLANEATGQPIRPGIPAASPSSAPSAGSPSEASPPDTSQVSLLGAQDAEING